MSKNLVACGMLQYSMYSVFLVGFEKHVPLLNFKIKIAQKILPHKNMLMIQSTINIFPLVFYLLHNMLKKKN